MINVGLFNRTSVYNKTEAKDDEVVSWFKPSQPAKPHEQLLAHFPTSGIRERIGRVKAGKPMG